MIWGLVSIFIVLDLLWWRWVDCRLLALRWAPLWRGLLAVFSGSMLLYLLLMLFWAIPIRSSNSPLPESVHTMVYFWHFIVLPALIPIWFVTKLVKRSRHRRGQASGSIAACGNVSPKQTPAPLFRPSTASQREPNSGPTRRQMMAAAAMALPPVATFAAAKYNVYHSNAYRLTRLTLPIPKLPRQLDGMTIAHVSDTHIGKFLHPDRLPAIADDINRIDADFIAFTGDLIDLSMDDLPYGVEFLRRLKSRCGMVICEGNHDIMQNRAAFENDMRDAGFPTLLGEERILHYVSREGRSYPVQFLGVPWNGAEPDMVRAVEFIAPAVRQDAFPILLAHHPHSFDAAAEAKIPLILSGHTHGGQIMLNSQQGLGRLRFRYTSGLYQKPGSSLIVNNGIGNWFPLRVNAPAELVHITLKSV